MATLLLQAAGSVVGGALGGPLGAILGRAVGSIAGAAIDASLTGAGNSTHRTGPRLQALAGVTSTEGAPVPRVYGRARVGGQMIWATRFEESSTTSGSSGGKGGGARATTTTFSYFANFAVGLCEGPVAQVRRIWADGKELDATLYTMRIYRGTEDQDADPLIVAKEGTADTPAYRGLAYVVFERLPLADFGNRVPQLTFEVVRPLNGLAERVQAVDLIPGASEFAYAPGFRQSNVAAGVSASENRHQLVAASDWYASLDALQAICPNLRSVALVVSWFGDDLRCGHCSIAPRVENNSKVMYGAPWSVAGIERGDARVISQVDGRPAYGGTPADDSVIDAIADLKARGLSVMFYPFVMMDIPAGNGLANPWNGANGQPDYPWRGRITCDPAIGLAGTVDATSTAGAQVASFFGAAEPDEAEWSFRRFILHYARLCANAGGVDAFLVGSELAALTRVRSAADVYPATQAIAQLADDVRNILGASTRISYAADWTEYGAYVRNGGADVSFPLDCVWASSSVNFVGIDAYWPISDWRDGLAHADASIASSIYDRDYLAGRVASGEAYDWYYADPTARGMQTRSAISDGAHGKSWVFRQKDIAGWWSNAHVGRSGGAELDHATAWVPRSKPIWLVETGCPAVDRGANAPNVFPDAKSSEGGAPWFSRGFRDDLIQMRMLEAVIRHFDPAEGPDADIRNPPSDRYDGRMVDLSRIHLWAWDARPFPAFPLLESVWGDAANWETGHWLNGRLEGVALDRLLPELSAEVATAGHLAIATDVAGYLDGYVVERSMSPRAAIEPLADLFGFDAVVSGTGIRFIARAARASTAIGADDLVPDRAGTLVRLSRAQESELPHELSITFLNGEIDYRPATVLSRRLEGASQRVNHAETAAVLYRAQAQRLADVWLRELWSGRETAQFSIRAGFIAPEVGDLVTLDIAGRSRLFRIERLVDGLQRDVTARAIEPAVYEHAPPRLQRDTVAAPALPGPARVEVLELGVTRDSSVTLQYVAAFALPWTGPLALYRANGESTFEFVRLINQPSMIGTTLDALEPGPVARIDRAHSIRVQFARGALASVDDKAMLSGSNVVALRGPDGAWEIVGFSRAELVGTSIWKISRLLRGQGGEEALARRQLPAGAPVVVLDRTVVPLVAGLQALGRSTRWRIGPANRDHADASYIEFDSIAGGKALAPLSPVRAKARRDAGGVVISFIRRSRIDADAWEAVEIPLAEDRENYEIDILSGVNVIRTLTTPQPSVRYAASDEWADFGQQRATLDLRIFQISSSVGRGYPLAASVAVL